ncbi:MAG: response regulator transcription factor [Bdellovibrionales bacterium]|nr:response regulator transcription factor [Bdellovibrionales bacterium]
MASVLLIDDDIKLADLLKQYLSGFDLHLTSAPHPTQGLRILRESNFDVVILDLMMPDMDGFEVCKRIRAFSSIPILMLTARGETTDKVLGLELGVDDYLAKPFDSRELVARLKALIRRSQKDFVKNRLQAGPLLLETQGRKASIGGKDLHLSTHEFELLKLFMTHPGQNLSRDQIMDSLKGVDWEAYQRGIDVAVSRLRQKLGDSVKDPRFLKTIWGEGYCFIHSVEDAP